MMSEQKTAVDQVTAKFNEKFFKEWKELADQALASLEEGLDKITFHIPAPASIIQLRQDLAEAKAVYSDPKLSNAEKKRLFVAVMAKTQRHIDIIVKDKEFSDPHINLLFMSARRAYTNLTGFMFKVVLNDYNKYITGVMNPGLREQEDQFRLQRFGMHVASRVTNNTINSMLNDAKTELLPSFHTIVANLPPSIASPGQPTANTNKGGKNCLLETQMGKTNYALSNQDALISTPEEAGAWLNRQIHRSSFDHFYTQSAQLYQILTKVETLASKEQTPEAVQHKRQALLREMGMEELGTLDARQYLNDVATVLGYENIEELNQNFIALNTTEGFDDFDLKKRAFVAHADEESLSAMEDPLEILKTLAVNEKDRILQKINRPDYQNNSAVYGMSAISNGVDFINGLSASQRAKNIATSIAEDCITADYIYPMIGLDEGGDLDEKVKIITNIGQTIRNNAVVNLTGRVVGAVANFSSPYLAALAEKTGAMQYANKLATSAKDMTVGAKEYARNYADQTLKSQLEQKLLSGMSDERYIQERSLSYISKNLNDTVFALRKEEMDKNNQGLKELINSVVSLDVNEVAIKNLAINEQLFNHSKQLLSQTNREKQPQEFLLHRENTRQLEQKYRNYQLAFEYSAVKKITHSTTEQRLALMREKQKDILACSENIEKIFSGLENNKQKNTRFLTSQKTFLGRLTRARDTVAKLFGYTTVTALKREERTKKLDLSAIETELDLAKLELEAHKSLFEKVESIETSKTQLETLSPIELKNELSDQIAAHRKSQRDMEKLYENSNSGTDINTQLLPLSIEYMQSANNIITISNILERKLNDPKAREELLLDGLSPIEQTLANLRSFRDQIDHYKNVLPLPETDERKKLQDSILHLEQIVFTTIQEERKQIESKVIDDFQAEVKKLFHKTDIATIHDPFHHVFSTLLNNQVQPISLHNQFIDVIAKEFISQLEKNKATLDRRKLEDLATGLSKGFHEFSAKPDQEGYINTLLNRYQLVQSKVEGILDERYHALVNLSFEDQRNILIELDADFIHQFQGLQLARQKFEAHQQSYSSWIKNPFGMITSQDSVGAAMSLVEAHSNQFYRFAERYNAVLESYVKAAPQWLNTLDKHALHSHIERLENEYNLIREITLDDENNPTLTKIRNTCENLIKLAKTVENNHPENRLEFIAKSRTALSDEFKKITELSHGLAQHIVTHNEFDEEKFEHFKELHQAITNNIGTIQSQISAIDQQHILPNRNTKSGSLATTQWAKEKSQLERELNQLTEDLAHIRHHELPAYHFYQQIAKGEAHTIPALDGKQFGKGLILAIHKGNLPLATQILEAAGSKISIQYLSKALLFAAEEGNMEFTKKILGSRNDISFNNSDLLFALSSALEKNHLEIVTYILYNTAIELDRDTAERLQNSVLSQKSTLSNVDRGLGQILVDNDGVYLDNIRECFAVQEGLLKHLEDEYNNLLRRSESLKDPSDPLYQSFERDLSQFFKKVERTVSLRDHMLEFYLKGNFDNTKRKDDHLTRWHSHLNAYLDKYRNAFKVTRPRKDISISEINDKIHAAILNGQNTSQLLFDLATLNRQLGSSDANQYYQIISEAVNFASQKGEVDALHILLSFVEDPERKAEYAYNALCESFAARQLDCMKYLIDHNAFIGREDETMHLLAQMYTNEINDSGALVDGFTKQALMQGLSHIPTEMNDTLADMIRGIAQSTPNSNISPMERGAWQRFVADSDGPKINDIQNVFRVSEQVYQDIHNVYLTLRNPFDNLRIERDYLTEEEIREYEDKVQLAEQSVAHQLSVLKDLREHYIQYVLDSKPAIANQARLQQQLGVWNSDLEKILTTVSKEFRNDLDHVKSQISQYKEEQVKNPNPPVKRRSLLYKGPDIELDSTRLPVEPASNRSSPRKFVPKPR